MSLGTEGLDDYHDSVAKYSSSHSGSPEYDDNNHRLGAYSNPRNWNTNCRKSACTKTSKIQITQKYLRVK